MDEIKTRKNKVQAYPFPAVIEAGGAKNPVDVLLINLTGIIARLKAQIVHVGEYHQIALELPVLHAFINARARVIKTYDKSVDPRAHLVERMVELHFEKLNEEQRNHISDYMRAIGQK